ncbi:MAG: hypothetical protein LBF58_04000 [Deltaproteobacteria bacterium]|nr:hypothetical protein [Deltaproteobacteria bacterium]
MLESDAKNANVILEEPIFENHWKQWVENQRGIRSDQTGTLFAKTLFGDSLKVNQRMLKDGRDCLKKSGSLAGDKKFDALEFTCAYAWAKSFALFSLFVSEKDRKEAIEGLQINKIINDLSGNHNVLSPILIDSEYIEVEKSLTAILKRQKEPIRFPFAFFLVVFHYAHLLDANETYSLDSFRNDLTYFDSKSGPQMRYALAYLVGSRMPDKSVTGLWYEKYKEGLPFVRK